MGALGGRGLLFYALKMESDDGGQEGGQELCAFPEHLQ